SLRCVAPLALISTLFPYTTLFRSSVEVEVALFGDADAIGEFAGGLRGAGVDEISRFRDAEGQHRHGEIREADVAKPPAATDADRSEEHTSELQSRVDLVCRLLLEK